MGGHMPKDAFWAEYKEASRKNNLLTYDEKLEVFNCYKRDWGTGEGKQPYRPHKYQEAFHRSHARIRAHVTGNRGGKSISGSMEILAHLTCPDTRMWVLGESYDICDREWDYIRYGVEKTEIWDEIIKKEILRQLKEKGVDEPAENYLRVIETKPRLIEINWPNEPRSFVAQKQYGKRIGGGRGLEGEKLSGVLMAEGSRVPEEIYQRNLDKRLSDKWGWIIIPATPKGKDQYLYKCYVKGISKKMHVDIDWEKEEIFVTYEKVKKDEHHIDLTDSYWDSYESFQYPAYKNPYYNTATYKADVKKLFKGDLSENVFKERNFGTFESMSGNYFVGVDFDEVFIEPYDPPPDATHYRSIDPGRASAACALWIWIEKDGTVVVYDELYQTGLWDVELAEQIIEQTMYPIEWSCADREVTRDTHHAKRSSEKQLREAGIDPLHTPKTMPVHTIDRLELWKNNLNKGKLKIFNTCKNLCHEMEALEYAEPKYKNGHVVKSTLLGNSPMHALDCLTYFYWMYPKHVSKKKKRKNVPDGSVADKESRDYESGSYMEAVGQNRTPKVNIGTW